MQGGSPFRIAPKIATAVVQLFQTYVKCESSAISVVQCKVQHCEVAHSNSPCNPIVTGRHGDAAAPRWLCRRWWMMPCWTSLRGASHNRSFQKGTASHGGLGNGMESNIHQQPAKQQRYQQTQFRAQKHYCFSLPPLFDSVRRWTGWVMLIWWIRCCCHDSMNLVIIGRNWVWMKRRSVKTEKFLFFICLILVWAS